MNYEEASVEIEEAAEPSDEAREKAADALAFVEGLHDFFKSIGMTTKDQPDLGELENLIDALCGELGAATIFLCEPSFARVPDMLRVVATQLEKAGDDSVPQNIINGNRRLAKRIENTRLNQQSLAVSKSSLDLLEPSDKL